MRLKLDENVDSRLAALLRQAGHDTTTVREEGLRGTADPALYEHCIEEGRFIDALTTDAPTGRLWIVEPGRIRIHEASPGGET